MSCWNEWRCSWGVFEQTASTFPDMQSETYHMDWFHEGGTRIRAEIEMEPGNNETDVERVFDLFCDSLKYTIFVKQESE